MSDNKLYEWFEQVQSLYEERYKMMLDNSDISDWSDYFHDGYTPQEAISDENLSG